MAAFNVYSYRRFLSKLHTPISRYASFIPVVLMIGDVFFVIEIVIPVIPESPALYMTTSAFVGFTFMLFVVALVYDLSITASSKVPFNLERRKALKIIFDITMLIAAMSYLLRGFAQGIKKPAVNHVDVRIKDFPIDGYCIVQISDVHVGRTIKEDFIKSLVEQANSLKPDIIVITGDLVDLPVDRIKVDLEPLKNLKAPTFFVLGNHEYFHGPEPILKHLESLGIRPLLNESVTIGDKNNSFNLVGINDISGERFDELHPDIESAYNNVDIDKPCVVLAHQPKFIGRMSKHRCDLMLSGHTHGGQIFPFGLLVMIDQPYLAGLYKHNAQQQIFVSRGTGYWGPPLRILAPSEISRLVIRTS